MKFKERMKNVSRLKEDTETCKVTQCKNPDWNLYWDKTEAIVGTAGDNWMECRDWGAVTDRC